MARGMNWSGAATRQRVQRQGAELAWKKVDAKRARKEAADAEIVTKVLRCACGHRGRIELPAAMLAGRSFKCSACGKVLR